MMSWGESGLPRQERERSPVGKQLFKDLLRAQFRALVRVITGHGPVPAMERRREKREAAGGFRYVAKALFRRVVSLPFFDVFNPSWDTHTWLSLWEPNDPENAGLYEHSTAIQEHDSGLSPRP